MFKKANKNELRTWMAGDIFVMAILFMVAFALFQQYSDQVIDPKISYLIFGIICLVLALLFLFLFYKMIMAFRSYDERMAILEKEQEEERIQREQEEKERLLREEEETKKFIEEYQKKVQESEEQIRLVKEQKRLAREQKGKK